MVYQSLYRTWRPQVLTDLVGQEHVRRILGNALKAERTAHAYLFCGPRGTGKTSTARILAKGLNCQEGPGVEPCDHCPACRRIARGEFLDVLEIDGASNRGIDEVRELRERISLAPAEGRAKVYIIDEVHMLTPEAFNALLKTLEDPPGHVTFVLATTEPHRLPPTIVSRCQRFDFHRLALEEIVGRLREILRQEQVEVEDRTLYLLARRAEGSLRDSLGLLEQCLALGEGVVAHEDVLRFLGVAPWDTLQRVMEAMHQARWATMLEELNAFLDYGGDAREFVRQFTAFLRNLLMVHLAPDASELLLASAEERNILKGLAPWFPPERLMRGIQYLGEVEQEMRWAPQPRVLLEVSTLRLAQSLGYGEKEQGSAVPPTRAEPESLPEQKPAEPEMPAREQQEPPGLTPSSEAPVANGDSPDVTAAVEQPGVRSEEGELGSAKPATEIPALEVLVENWPRILDLVHQRLPLSRGVVDDARPGKLEGERLLLVFSQPMWQEKVARGHREELERAIAEVCGFRVQVHCQEGGRAVEDPTPVEGSLVQEVMELFGPELVQVVSETGEEGGGDDGNGQDDETNAETAE